MTGTVKGHTTVTVQKNNENLFHIHEGNDYDTNNRISYSWIEFMSAGDTLKLTVVSNVLFADSENFVEFYGFSLVRKYFLKSKIKG